MHSTMLNLRRLAFDHVEFLLLESLVLCHMRIGCAGRQLREPHCVGHWRIPHQAGVLSAGRKRSAVAVFQWSVGRYVTKPPLSGRLAQSRPGVCAKGSHDRVLHDCAVADLAAPLSHRRPASFRTVVGQDAAYSWYT